jgi:arsenate reductase
MKRVLFVCRQNAGRSQMASAFAERHGDGLIVVYSAGSEPANAVHPVVVDVMREKGFDFSGRKPVSIEGLPVDIFDLVITMGCGDACPNVPADKRIDWKLKDPDGETYPVVRQIRDEIEKRIMDLVKSLEEN